MLKGFTKTHAKTHSFFMSYQNLDSLQLLNLQFCLHKRFLRRLIHFNIYWEVIAVVLSFFLVFVIA